MPDAGLLLVLSAGATAVLHMVVPDHWLPFVLVGKAQGWTAARTTGFAALSAVLHVLVSVGLGLAAYLAGLASVERMGEHVARVGSIVLILFGLGYIFWAWRSHGGILHLGSAHGSHQFEETLEQRKSMITGRSLAVLMGLNPCLPALPIIFATLSYGAPVTLLVSAAFAAATIASLVIFTLAGTLTAARLRLRLLSRYGEMTSGALISLVGLTGLLVG